MKKPVSIHSPGRLTVLAALLAGLCAPALAASDVVISQVYGAGGNSGSVLRNDYVELFNRTGAAIDIGGWAVQYASATGTSWQVTPIPAGKSIGPLQYFIVREAAQGAGTTDVPADVSGIIPMGAGAGKVALTNNATPLTGAASSGGAVLDFVGFGSTATAFEGAGPTPAPSVANAVFRKLGGCTDTDSNSGDFAATTAAPRSSASPANSCAGVTPQAAPIVITSCPATLAFVAGSGASAGLAATDSDSVVNAVSIFSGAVPGISLSGFSPAAAANGSATVNLTVDPSVASGNYPVVVRFTNSDSQTKDCSVTIKGEGVHTIPQIQGSGATSPYADSVQTTEGVITLKVGAGFFMQDLNGDGDPTTSDGIFVFGGTTSAGVGDLVRVKGTVTEFRPSNATRSYTELKDIASIETLGGGHGITPTPVAMPADLAQYEGMLVRFSNPLIVNSVSSLGERGEMTLASVRREVPTNHYPAGSQAALDMARNNAIDQIVLDDGIFTQSPTIPYIGADQTVRVGDSVTDLVGLVDYGSIGNSKAGFKLQPLSVPSVTISRTNPRSAGPVLPAANVRVASANVLNFFTTFTNGFNYLTKTTTGCGIGTPLRFANGNCRGADSETEFLRQRDKIVNELAALNADVVGLMEIQNNGDLSVSYLVDALNTKLGSVQYAYVANVPSPGDDAIRVAMIYRPSVVTAVGAPMSDDVAINNRAPIAQTFKANNNGGKFSVIVNHLKSKGSCPGGTGVDADHNDSQGCWNGTRIEQAQRLIDSFIPAVKTASGDGDVLLIGDFNSHGFEDPINLLTANGMLNQLETFVRPNGIVYSYVFDSLSGYLDHALASTSLASQVAGATEWHNNADEPDAIDYNLDGKPQDLYVNNAYRASDHDPVVVSLNLAPTFVDSTASFSVVRSAFIMNRQSGLFSGSYSFTNKTGAAVHGPFQVQIAGLPAGVTVTNASGTHNGVPYITASAASVAPGATATVTLVLSNPNKVALNYAATIYSGTF